MIHRSRVNSHCRWLVFIELRAMYQYTAEQEFLYSFETGKTVSNTASYIANGQYNLVFLVLQSHVNFINKLNERMTFNTPWLFHPFEMRMSGRAGDTSRSMALSPQATVWRHWYTIVRFLQMRNASRKDHIKHRVYTVYCIERQICTELLVEMLVALLFVCNALTGELRVN